MQPLYWLCNSVCYASVCVQCDVVRPIKYDSRFNVSLWSDLNCELPISYLCVIIFCLSVCEWLRLCTYGRTSVAGVCVCVRACICVCTCVCPVWRCVFLYPLSWRLSATKARLCSSTLFALHWWESAAPLIVFGVLGQVTEMRACVRACAHSIWKFLFFHFPSYADFLFVSPVCASWALCAVLHNSVSIIHLIEVSFLRVLSQCDDSYKKEFSIQYCIKWSRTTLGL